MARGLLGERQAGDLPLHRVAGQRVHRALQAEEDADGAGATWPRIRTPSALACVEQLELPRALRRVDAGASENDSGRPDASAMRRNEAELGVDVVEVGDHLQHAGAGGADGPRRCRPARRRSAVSVGVSSPLRAAVVEGARGA